MTEEEKIIIESARQFYESMGITFTTFIRDSILNTIRLKEREFQDKLEEIRSSMLQLLLHNGFTDETLVSLPGVLEILDKHLDDKK